MILTARSRKARNRIQNNGGVDAGWKCIDRKMRVGFTHQGGPWLLISHPTYAYMFWVHAHADEHFTVENHKDTETVTIKL